MILDGKFKTLKTAALALMLSACTAMPQSQTPEVALNDKVSVQLPSARSLGYSLAASQLIVATWNADESKRSEQLPVQLQVNADKLVLAGFSSWGTRILSLEYQDDQISTELLTGLKGVLPQPEQVLFNLMITLWPSSAWEAPLNKVKWQIIDTENSRAIFNSAGEQVIDIQYSNADKLAGEIRFHHLIDDYTITITTLQRQIAPLTP